MMHLTDFNIRSFLNLIKSINDKNNRDKLDIFTHIESTIKSKALSIQLRLDHLK